MFSLITKNEFQNGLEGHDFKAYNIQKGEKCKTMGSQFAHNI